MLKVEQEVAQNAQIYRIGGGAIVFFALEQEKTPYMADLHKNWHKYCLNKNRSQFLAPVAL